MVKICEIWEKFKWDFKKIFEMKYLWNFNFNEISVKFNYKFSDIQIPLKFQWYFSDNFNEIPLHMVINILGYFPLI